jgi:hypothetical protein
MNPSSHQSVKKSFENIELAKLVDSLREKNHSIGKVIRQPVMLQPSFHPSK